MSRRGLLGLWVSSAVAVLWAWSGGIALWGSPPSGYQTAPPPTKVFIAVALVGGVVMVPAGIGLGLTASSHHRAARWGSIVGWLIGLMLMMWITPFVHFEGFCVDHGDVCAFSWTSRIVGLLLALAFVVIAAVASLRLAATRQPVNVL